MSWLEAQMLIYLMVMLPQVLLKHLEFRNLSLLAKVRNLVSTQLPAHSVTDVDTCMTVCAHEAL